MAGAPYQVNLSFTDDETYSFAIFLDALGGAEIEWPEYRPEYSVTRLCGSRVIYTIDNGLVVDESLNRITAVLRDLALRPGVYRHGLRFYHIPTDTYCQLFDGQVTITEGNFPRGAI